MENDREMRECVKKNRLRERKLIIQKETYNAEKERKMERQKS